MTITERPVRFLLNGQAVSIGAIDPTRTVLEYLRDDQRCTGTKEGCAEGDCGACTVVVGELIDDALQLRTVNACLQLVPMLDGKALFTVESLCGDEVFGDVGNDGDGKGGALHPVQQAMVDHHGSQCGFCTPGFVMSLWNTYLEHRAGGTRPDRAALATALSGNLCRCTGYRPILDAGQAMFEYPAAHFDGQAVVQALRALDTSEPLALSRAGTHYVAPRTLTELLRLRRDRPEATILAGCTDIGLWLNKQFRELGSLIDIGRVAELSAVQRTASHLRIGAGVSLSTAYAALAEHYPELAQMWDRFASVPIRNAGTLGGNVANGSPIGDSMPWLIALQAQVVLASIDGSRRLPLEDLYVDYMQKSMRADELVEAIEIPRPVSGLQFRTYKVCKRYDSDISAVCAAFAIKLDADRIVEARVAFGGMAAVPRRAPGCEQSLVGQSWNESTAHTAMRALNNDYTPLDDMRASREYRVRVAQNLLYRFYLETRPKRPLPAVQLSVFPDVARPSMGEIS